MFILAASLLLFTADSVKPKIDPTYEKVFEWIDTVSNNDDGSFEYLNDGERQKERNRYKYGPRNEDDLQPTHYPSPYRKLFDV